MRLGIINAHWHHFSSTPSSTIASVCAYRGSPLPETTALANDSPRTRRFLITLSLSSLASAAARCRLSALVGVPVADGTPRGKPSSHVSFSFSPLCPHAVCPLIHFEWQLNLHARGSPSCRVHWTCVPCVTIRVPSIPIAGAPQYLLQ